MTAFLEKNIEPFGPDEEETNKISEENESEEALIMRQKMQQYAEGMKTNNDTHSLSMHMKPARDSAKKCGKIPLKPHYSAQKLTW